VVEPQLDHPKGPGWIPRLYSRLVSLCIHGCLLLTIQFICKAIILYLIIWYIKWKHKNNKWLCCTEVEIFSLESSLAGLGISPLTCHGSSKYCWGWLMRKLVACSLDFLFLAHLRTMSLRWAFVRAHCASSLSPPVSQQFL